MPETTSAVSNARFARLARGVNLSHWYAQSDDYSEKKLSTYIAQHDAELIAKMGYTHVRLTLDESPLLTETAQIKPEALQSFRKRLQWFLDAKLAVVVDLHPTEEFKKSVHSDPKVAAMLVTWWGNLASALADLDPEWVFFEVMNEPAANAGPAWRATQEQCVQAIRQAAANHTIIVSPGAWQSNTDQAAFEPYADLNLIYSIHWYGPLLFTHQDATWARPECKFIEQLPWPAAPEDAEKLAAKVTRNEQAARVVIEQAREGRYTEQWTIDQLELVSAWQKKHGNPRVYNGEFGVLKRHAPVASRLRWHQVVREQCESRGWGWAVWDYAGGFGVVELVNGQRVPDEALRKALGLA